MDLSLPCIGTELAGHKAALSLKAASLCCHGQASWELSGSVVRAPELVHQLQQLQSRFVVRWSNDLSDLSPLKALITHFQSFS